MNACAKCGTTGMLLVALHGDRGGPDVCLDCSATIHGEIGARRRERANDPWNPENLGSVFADKRYARRGQLDTELLKDLITLTHPDLHPQRREMATRVAARLTAMRPFVLPPAPPPEPRNGSEASDSVDLGGPVTESCNGSKKDHTEKCSGSVTTRCRECRGALQEEFWCDQCRTEAEQERERSRRARTLERTAAECWECGVRLTEGVWRIPAYVEGRWWGRNVLLPHCQSCFERKRERYPYKDWHFLTRPCQNCGRQVTTRWAVNRRVWSCGTSCAAIALRRLKRSLSVHRCEYCGEEFTPSRKDQRYCKEAHRVAAWRRRSAGISAARGVECAHT
jgi:hypothetical protein